jgi:hypothetical protein
MATIRDTGDIRERLLKIWKLIDEKKISATEARLQISLARALLDTLKVEIAAVHLSQAQIPSVSLTTRSDVVPITRRQQ